MDEMRIYDSAMTASEVSSLVPEPTCAGILVIASVFGHASPTSKFRQFRRTVVLACRRLKVRIRKGPQNGPHIGVTEGSTSAAQGYELSICNSYIECEIRVFGPPT